MTLQNDVVHAGPSFYKVVPRRYALFYFICVEMVGVVLAVI